MLTSISWVYNLPCVLQNPTCLLHTVFECRVTTPGQRDIEAAGLPLPLPSRSICHSSQPEHTNFPHVL